MTRIPPKPLKPDEMRYIDIGLAEVCDCPSCTDKRRLTDTIEILAIQLKDADLFMDIENEEAFHSQLPDIAVAWIEWARKLDENKNK